MSKEELVACIDDAVCDAYSDYCDEEQVCAVNLTDEQMEVWNEHVNALADLILELLNK